MYHVYPFLLLAFVLTPTLSTSQTPFAITGQRAISGNTSDVFGKIIPLSENSQLVIGHTQASQELDHQSSSNGGHDIWVVKEENESISWEISLGGLNEEFLVDAIVDGDGNIMLFTSSNSGISGDKTEGTYGLFDFWVIKLDTNGNILWDRTYGGSEADFAIKIFATNSGYMLLGNSNSPISGNKDKALIGVTDIWILNINFDGDVINQNVIGTTEYEVVEDAVLLNNNEVLITSLSYGLQNNSKTSPNYGDGDCWVVKYDFTNQLITNQTTLGGFEVEQESIVSKVDDFVFVSMTSRSGIGGNKVSPAFSGGDIWLLKLNAQLQILAQNTYGGNRLDRPRQICYNPQISSSLFILGDSESNANTGQKTVENFGEFDAYFVEVGKDDLAQVADTVFGGVNADFASFGHNTSNGFEFILFSESGLTGNKTVPLKSLRDQWLINLEFEPNAIKEISVGTEFTVFPNPAKTEIQLKGVNSGKRYYLYDAQNRVVKSGRYNQNQSIGLSELASGVYFLRVQDHQQVSKVLVH